MILGNVFQASLSVALSTQSTFKLSLRQKEISSFEYVCLLASLLLYVQLSGAGEHRAFCVSP